MTVTGAGKFQLSSGPCLQRRVQCGPRQCDGYALQAAYTFAGDANHDGSTGSTSITITPTAATVTLDNLTQTYNGTPRSATVTPSLQGLTVEVRYDGSLTPPTALGSYAVVATVTNPNYTGSAKRDAGHRASHRHSQHLPRTGWNLASFNLQPPDTDITTVLSSLSGSYDLVYAWDASGAHSMAATG